MKMTKSLIHGIGQCRDCKWDSENYLTIQEAARRHAKRTGHVVSVEFGYAVTYDGRKP